MRNKKLIYIFIIFLIILFFFSFKEINAASLKSNVPYNTKTYTVPDLETLNSTYYSYAQDYGYVVCVSSTDTQLIVLGNSSSYFYKDTCNSLGCKLRATGYIYYFKSSGGSWVYSSKLSSASAQSISSVVYFGCSVYNDSNKSSLFYDASPTVFPSITNVESDLSNGTDNYFLIHPGTFSGNDNITFDILLVENETTSEIMYQETLNNDSPYYKSVVVGNALEFWYEIPFSDLSFNFIKEKSYLLTLSGVTDEGEWSVTKQFKFVGMSEEDIYHSISSDIDKATNSVVNAIAAGNENLQNTIEQQTEVQEEQLETSKGIWASIKEVISYINPHSENFFVIKLIDLLINALKDLFVPNAEFFNNWVSDMNEYFGNRFGLLYYPIELVAEFLTRLYDLSDSLDNNFVLSFPDLKLFDVVLINGFSFNFNALLENETFKNVYDIYLICVDVVLILGLVVLCKNTFVDIFGGKFVDDVVHATQAAEISYRNYDRQKFNEAKFRSLHGKNKYF